MTSRQRSSGPLRSAVAMTTMAALLGACSTGSTSGTTGVGSGARSSAVGAGLSNADGLLDASTVHDVSITFDQSDYDAMIATFRSTGDKEWIEATVTLDGTTYERAGLRLKGNSSLQGLRRSSNQNQANQGQGGPGGNASAEDPEALPWLIDLDQYVDGQDHDGLTEIVVRSNTSQTSINEAVALDLLELAGLASEDAALTRLSVNGSAEKLRLLVQHLDEAWEEDEFDNTGLVYKAEAGGNYDYRGEDAAAYDEVFDQETGVDDLAPLATFLKFINTSDDATFAAELDQHLDIEAFATYLAMMDLLDNFDDIDGPGNNSYLRYDPQTKKFTVVAWDLNLAFGAMGGGPGGRGGGQPPAGMQPPDGMQAPDGAQAPAADQVTADAQAPVVQGQNGRAGGPRGGNILAERFTKNTEFAARYEQAVTDLRAKLYASGDASEVLDGWVSVINAQAADLVPSANVTEEAEAIAAAFSVG